MIKRENIVISKVHPNDGQIAGLPKNPRLIKGERFRKLCKSIKELPEMTEARDILVYPYNGGYIVIGGNMRLHAYRHLGWKEVPCCILPEDMPVEKLRQMLIQDNNPFGETDWDMIANEWDGKELDDWGFEGWQEPEQKSSERSSEEQQEEESEEDIEKADFYDMMLGDRIYDSNNDFDIPNLRADEQPVSGLVIPLSAWGADTRQKKGISTYHFYVEDYRFEAIWKDPTTVLNSGCEAVIEPNLSLFDTTPVAYGLHQIYKKRWISRYWQE